MPTSQWAACTVVICAGSGSHRLSEANESPRLKHEPDDMLGALMIRRHEGLAVWHANVSMAQHCISFLSMTNDRITIASVGVVARQHGGLSNIPRPANTRISQQPRFRRLSPLEAHASASNHNVTCMRLPPPNLSLIRADASPFNAFCRATYSASVSPTSRSMLLVSVVPPPAPAPPPKVLLLPPPPNEFAEAVGAARFGSSVGSGLPSTDATNLAGHGMAARRGKQARAMR